MKPILLVGTDGYSVWYSDDLGESFNRLRSDAGLYSESRVYAITPDPADPQRVLVGTDSGLYQFDAFGPGGLVLFDPFHRRRQDLGCDPGRDGFPTDLRVCHNTARDAHPDFPGRSDACLGLDGIGRRLGQH